MRRQRLRAALQPVVAGIRTMGDLGFFIDELSFVPDLRLTYSGGTNGTYFDSTGTLQSAVINWVRNSILAGAVVADGVERITNGTFTGTSGTGWTVVLNGGTGSVNFSVTGQATITGDGTNQTNLTQAITTVVGNTYTITLTNTANVFVQAGNSSGSSTLLGTTVTAGTAKKVQFTASATTTYVGFALTSGSVTVSAISTQSAGVLPTNTSVTASGLVRTVVGSGVLNGLPYYDVRLAGTTSGTFSNVTLDALTATPAENGQSWTHSIHLAVIAGSTSNVTSTKVRMGLYNSSSTYLGDIGSPPDINGSLSASLQRFNHAGTISNASTAYTAAYLQLAWSSGVAIDITLRIGLPQLQRGLVATDPIITNGSAGGPRYDYDPVTLAKRGRLDEEQRTNSIRNPTAVGAVAGVIGSGGVLATNWGASIQTTTGLTRTVIGSGTESGIPYVDLRISGTASGNGFLVINTEAASATASGNAASWAHSVFLRMVGGTTTGIGTTTRQLKIDLYNGGAYLTGVVAGMAAMPTAAPLNTQRFTSGTLTTNNASTTNIQPIVSFNLVDGATIDITLRIGLPQLEAMGSSTIGATSPIFQTGNSTTAVTRTADLVAGAISNFPGYVQNSGTFVSEAMVYALPTATNTPGIISVEGTSPQGHCLRFSPTGVLTVQSRDATLNVLTSGAAGGFVPTSNVPFRVAGVLSSALRNCVGNAGTLRSDSTALTNGAMTTLRIGNQQVGSGAVSTAKLSGWSRRTWYFKPGFADPRTQLASRAV